MAQVINTNVASLNTQRNLNNTQNQLNIALQRLSSGLRINSAKDDAAGLAISERFTAQIRGLNQAARNANDGVSLSQTAEGDLSQITNNLQRLRELAVQSANATNSTSDRAALQLETNELIAEIDRVASTSAFNGVRLLDGNFAAQQFQVGANAGETVNITSIASARTSTLGQALTATAAGGALTGGLTAGQLTINTIDVGVVAQDAALIAAAITNTGTDVTATATNAQTAIVFGDSIGTVAAAAVQNDTAVAGAHTTSVASAAAQTYSITVDGTVAFTVTSAGAAENLTAAQIDTGIGTNTATLNAAGITFSGTAAGNDLVFSKADGTSFDIVVANGFATTAGGFAGADFATGTNTVNNGTAAVAVVAPAYTLSVDGNNLDFTTVGADGTITGAEVATQISALTGYTSSFAGGNLSITKADGSNIVLVDAGADAAAAEGLAGAAGTATYYGTVSVTSTNADLVIGGTAAGNAGLTAGTTTAALAGVTVANTDISTVAGANAAIASIDNALTTINSSRASLGAIQNRFSSIVSSIQTSAENLSAARSRIRDADFAQETAELTRGQILQQAGVSILSQANSLPQLALSLLQ